MSDPVRPSSNEVAREDARKSAERRVRPKQAAKTATAYGAQQNKNNPEGKKIQTPFDQVLENLSEKSVAVMGNESSFENRLQEIKQDDEDRSSQDHEGDRDEDNKVKDRGEKGEKGKESTQATRGRVSAKSTLKDEKRGSSGEQQDQGSQKGSGQKDSQQLAKMAQNAQKDPMTAPTAGFPLTPGAFPAEFQTPTAPKELPKAVLDQIVQYVKITRDKDLKKEMEIDFRDNFFNGMRLRVTSQGGEISVEFIVPNQSVESTFRNEREKIAAALGDKGIDVRSIQVTRR